MSKLSDLIPGGCMTYSKGADVFPGNAPEYIVKGKGAYVWDDNGNKFLDFGMGLRSVILGHSFNEVDQAVIHAIANGVNFLRPCLLEKELAELLIDIIPSAEMVKFGKSGSDVTSAAVKLARAYTKRDLVVTVRENPFISQHDWYIGTTPVSAGIPVSTSSTTRVCSYNHLEESLSELNLIEGEHHHIAAIILDPATVSITKEKLQFIRDFCNKHGIVMILDEMISGFRYGISGVQGLFGITPDLSTFGKAMGNGYSVSALCGKREIMQLGDRRYGDVFLLSGTFNAETVGLAAAISTIKFLRKNINVVGHLNSLGRALTTRLTSLTEEHGISNLIRPSCFCTDGIIVGSNPTISFSGMVIKTIFDQHMVEKGILMPYIAPSYSHTYDDIQKTTDAADYAMKKVVEAINSENIEDACINGHIEKAIFRRCVKEKHND